MKASELSCEEVIEQLFDWLDCRLDERREADIRHHVERCRECFSRAEFERRLRARLTEAGEARAPERLRKRVRNLLDEF